jgi:Tfp pilus assembly protein PilX
MTSQNFQHVQHRQFQPKQRGIALVVGLIFMLVLTIVGLTAVRFSTQQGRMAVNMQFLTATFQGAETAIRGVVCEVRAQASCPPVDGTNVLVAALGPGNPPQTRNYDAAVGEGFTSRATVAFNDVGPAPGFSLGVGSGAIVAYRFRITATSTHTNTSSQADHLQGIQRIGPK